jgi:hypothetical protein
MEGTEPIKELPNRQTKIQCETDESKLQEAVRINQKKQREKYNRRVTKRYNDINPKDHLGE